MDRSWKAGNVLIFVPVSRPLPAVSGGSKVTYIHRPGSHAVPLSELRKKNHIVIPVKKYEYAATLPASTKRRVHSRLTERSPICLFNHRSPVKQQLNVS